MATGSRIHLVSHSDVRRFVTPFRSGPVRSPLPMVWQATHWVSKVFWPALTSAVALGPLVAAPASADPPAGLSDLSQAKAQLSARNMAAEEVSEGRMARPWCPKARLSDNRHHAQSLRFADAFTEILGGVER